jgi:hypothetical protein
MTDASSIYHKARAEVASMLRLQDLDNLSGEDAIRLDVGTSLRVLMDISVIFPTFIHLSLRVRRFGPSVEARSSIPK